MAKMHSMLRLHKAACELLPPAGPPGGSHRVFRGGGWFYPAGVCRSAYRDHHLAGFRDHVVGFRVSLVPADTAGKPTESTAATAQEKTAEVVASPSAIQNHKSEISAPPLAIAPFNEKKADDREVAQWALDIKGRRVEVELASGERKSVNPLPHEPFRVTAPRLATL